MLNFACRPCNHYFSIDVEKLSNRTTDIVCPVCGINKVDVDIDRLRNLAIQILNAQAQINESKESINALIENFNSEKHSYEKWNIELTI